MGLFAGVAAGVARRVTCSQKLYQMKLEFSRTFESEELTGTVTRLSSSVCVTHLQHKPTHPVPTTFRQVATPSHPLQSRNVFGGNAVAVQVPMPANRANQRCLLRGTLNAFAATVMPGGYIDHWRAPQHTTVTPGGAGHGEAALVQIQ